MLAPASECGRENKSCAPSVHLSVNMCCVTDVIDPEHYTGMPVQAVLWHVTALGLALFPSLLSLSPVNFFPYCAVAEDLALLSSWALLQKRFDTLWAHLQLWLRAEMLVWLVEYLRSQVG